MRTRLTTSTNALSFLVDGGEMGTLIRQFDWSQTALGTPDGWPQSLRTTLSIVLNSRFPMFLFWGPEHLCFYNDAYRPSLGEAGRHPAALGQPGQQVWPDIWGVIKPLIDQVMSGGEATYEQDKLLPIVRNGKLEDVYWTASYSPVVDEQGRINGVFATCFESTTAVHHKQQLETSEAHLQLLRNTVPAMIFYLDAQQRYQSYNDTFMRWFGVDQTEVIGKTVREFLGEAAYQGVQPHLAVAYAGQVDQYELFAPSRMGDARWLSITYTPHHTPAGEVIGLIVHAADITPSKQSEVILREREAVLQNAIELAELGTFSVDIATNRLTVSPRVADWFGFESLWADTEAFIGGVGESERAYVRSSLYDTLASGSDGRYDVIHSVIHAQSGQKRILHALGRVYFDAAGHPLKIEGTAQDITLDRELQLALEQQVQQRTEELATSNDALTTTNNELATANQGYAELNEALQEANGLLRRSNENLQTFAYIASHDLQEPLRKIQQFGDLLKTRYADSTGEESLYLERMQLAARRMSTLIKDLLDYSRISTRRDASAPVSLDAIVAGVLTTLEWTIQETGAQIRIEPLPTLPGDGSQLGQLFQNLLANALKFRRPNTVPLIEVRAMRVAAADLPVGVKPGRSADQYYRIEVADNGIGFETKYVDRIFQVFQRLHGKHEFAGTGIGLAICEKVVTNHGGAITARSQPGQGAIFSVYLPA